MVCAPSVTSEKEAEKEAENFSWKGRTILSETIQVNIPICMPKRLPLVVSLKVLMVLTSSQQCETFALFPRDQWYLFFSSLLISLVDISASGFKA